MQPFGCSCLRLTAFGLPDRKRVGEEHVRLAFERCNGTGDDAPEGVFVVTQLSPARLVGGRHECGCACGFGLVAVGTC